MKKKYKRFDVKNFDLKLFLSLLSGAIILTGYKLYKIDKDNSQGEINIIKDTTIESTEEQHEIPISTQTYTYTELEPQSSDYYRSIEIDGKVLNFANTPTPTPTPRYDLIDSYTDDMITGEDGVYPDGWFEYQDRKEHKLNFDTVDEAISFYSKVFELNEDVSSNVIKGFIGNEEYPLKEEIEINGTTYSSLEGGISRILCTLSNSPSSYGYSESDVRSTEGYQLDYYYPEELIYKFSDVLGVNPYTALAISYGECGRDLGSYLCVYDCNYGGMVVNGSFAKYKNPANGIFEYVKMLHDRCEVTENSSSKDIHGYAENMTYWHNLVGGIEYELCTNGYTSIMKKKGRLNREFVYSDEIIVSFYNSKYYTLKKDEN